MTVKTKPTERGAVLQFEIDRKRWMETTVVSATGTEETPDGRLRRIVVTAARDTLTNGGTFVLVVTPEKVTMVQRPDAEDEL